MVGMKIIDIDRDECKQILEDHRLYYGDWYENIKDDEELSKPGDKPFTKIVDDQGDCLGLAILLCSTRLFSNKGKIIIYCLEIFDESTLSKDEFKKALYDKYPNAVKIVTSFVDGEREKEY